ncbi:CHRD domain-containing protein [Kribbella deserti]|uniref:CHRD domain-containing protein n=1 Tax=Kribbella deserti TaxID=1926257 RepID=A0ABV6QDE3_9ACTN
MSLRKYLLPVVATGVAAATALGGAAVLGGAAFAHNADPAGSAGNPAADSPVSHQHHADTASSATTHAHESGRGASTSTGYASAGKGDAVYFAARLSGKNEVSNGDPDGRATGLVRIKGDQVSYALRWHKTTAPKAFHIHQGVAGTNGGVKVDFLGSDIPAGVEAITGSVRVTDRALLDSIRANPAGFYLNLHTAEHPGGAVRGQLHRLRHAVNLNGVLEGGPAANLHSKADGKQEVPGPKPSGDPDGRAFWLLRTREDKVSYLSVWTGIAAPTNGHIHAGVKGVNGPVVGDLFADADGLPPSVTGVAGTATVGVEVAQQLAKEPSRFYTNLHTTEFSGGAVRGQIAKHRPEAPKQSCLLNELAVAPLTDLISLNVC